MGGGGLKANRWHNSMIDEGRALQNGRKEEIGVSEQKNIMRLRFGERE